MRVLSGLASAAVVMTGASSAFAASEPQLPLPGGGYLMEVCHGQACAFENNYYAQDGSNFGDHAFDPGEAQLLVRGFRAPVASMFAEATSKAGPDVTAHAETDVQYFFRYTAPSLEAAAALDAYRQSLVDAGAMCGDRRCRANTVPVVSLSGFYGVSATGSNAQATVSGSGGGDDLFAPLCRGAGPLAANCGHGAWSVLAPLTKVSDLSYDGLVSLSADVRISSDVGPCDNNCFGSASAYIDPVISFRPEFAGGDAFTLTLSPGFGNASAPPPAASAPEPTTWALMIAGLGLAGAVLRRRRQASAA